MSAAIPIPGSPESLKARRIEKLAAADPQFRNAFPLDSVNTAKRQPGLRLAQIVQIVMEGYADRPALAQRARELVTDPATGRRTLRLLPRFDTITYRDLWQRARAVASVWHHEAPPAIQPGSFVCILGFTAPEYATLILASIHLGAVIVPLQTSAPPRQHADIIAETQPHIVATSIDYLEAAVDAVLLGTPPRRLLVFDYDSQDDEQRHKLESAGRRLEQACGGCILDTVDAMVSRSRSLPAAPLFVPNAEDNPLSWLFYTSGSTGTPKGAMFTERLVVGTWLSDTRIPTITLSFMPMSHLVGNGYLLLALANGGISYCSPKADLSTLFDDFALARPTMASLVPRVCELLHHFYLGQLSRRLAGGTDRETVEDEVKREMREEMLGGRLLSVGCGSASLAPETYAFMESMLDQHMPIGYSATEIAGGTVLIDWKIQRPPVLAYKLADVPELGYFNTDKPHPRGELLVKSDRFMAGYYKRPDLTAERFDAEGFYRTGDVMAEIGPDQLVYLDRRNNVIKLSQGEFVAISRLEALYSHSPLIRQIYIYGSGERAFLLAIIVPAESLNATLGGQELEAENVKSAIRRSLHQIAAEQRLNSYEIPRDFLIETTPFSLENGLLSEIGKHQRPKLREAYGDRLEQRYSQLALDQLNELQALRRGASDRPVLETVGRALQATLGVAAADIRAAARFSDLGGDSLSALTFSTLLKEIFDVEVPVGMMIGPTGDVQQLANYIEAERKSGARRPNFAKVHGAGSGAPGGSQVVSGGQTWVHASDLTLDKFMDAQVLANAASLPRSSEPIRTVLMTGATGFLGRFQALAWLEKLAQTGGKLICIARGSDSFQARQRIEAALATDPRLVMRFRSLAAENIEVLPGDIGLPALGLDEATWKRLADAVDVIVHPAAHVNHVLPYNQLFTANVVGTAELIRLAVSSKLKRFQYVSTLGVNALADRLVDEDSDIRRSIPGCRLEDSYANGYGISKWASEVLLREAFDLCALPVTVFRPGMILAHSRYAGQLNVPDMFTRLLFSLVATGVAPSTFYALDGSKGRPRARYDGLTVDFLAEFVTEIGARNTEGFHSYNLTATHEDAVSLDHCVDWMIEAGCKIERIDSYEEWLTRFSTAMSALPEKMRQESVLTLLEPYRRPQRAVAKSLLPAGRFQAAATAAALAIPRLSAELINKYVADLRHVGML